MQFTPVSRDEIPAGRTREGKVSTKLFRDFVDSGADLVQLNPDEDGNFNGKTMASVRSTLSNYAKRHVLPVRIFTIGGGLYLERITPEEAQKLYVENATEDTGSEDAAADAAAEVG